MTGRQAAEEAVKGSCAFRPFAHDIKPTPAHIAETGQQHSSSV